jgi:O-antigen ligase
MFETAAYLTLFLFPFGYFFWHWNRSKAGIPFAVLGGYVYPLTLLTMLSTEGFSLPNLSISMETANLLRAGVHGLFALWFARVALKSRSRFRAVPGTIAALVAVSLMFLSAIILGSGRDALLRIALLLLMLLNIFVLIPTVAGDDQRNYYRELIRGSIFLALYVAVLSTIVIGLQGNFPPWSWRLGRPLNPGVLSILLVFAFISATFVNRNLIVIGGLFIALVATGSRFPLAFAVVWFILQGIKKASAWRRVGLLLVALFSVGLLFLVQSREIASGEQGVFERTDIWSGRVLLWAEVMDSIDTAPFWGRGDRVFLENVYTEGEQEDIRPHNMVLENSMSYGIPASLAAFAVYVAMSFTAYRAWRLRQLRWEVLYFAPMCLYLLAVQFGATMVETTNWTNLGDGGNILFFMFVGPGLAIAKTAMIPLRKARGLHSRIVGKPQPGHSGKHSTAEGSVS